MQTVAAGLVLLWATSATARRSAATRAVVQQCISLGEAPIQENSVYIYDELYHTTKNPFLWKDNEPIPFDKMHPSRLLSAACELVQDLHAGLDELESETIATWHKVVQPLVLLYDSYERVTGVFELLATVMQTAPMEEVAHQGKELASSFSHRLEQSMALYALLLRVRDRSTGADELSHWQLRALDHWILVIEDRGIHFASNPAKAAEFKRLDDEEASLKRQFISNAFDGTNAFHLTLRSGKHLRGVPRSTLAAMAAAAQRRGFAYSRGWTWASTPPSTAAPVENTEPTQQWGPWTVTFDPRIYESMMSTCPDRHLRQIIYQSSESRASQAPWDNVPVMERLLQVRRSKALLLGASSYAELVGRRRMANPHTVNKLLDELSAPMASAAVRTLLRMVRLMADSEASGEDVWGEQYRATNFKLMGATGSRLALDQNSEVSVESETTEEFRSTKLGSHKRPWTKLLTPPPTQPKINVLALEYAESIMQNSTLSQPDCVALFANVTTHFREWDAFYWLRRLESSAPPPGETAVSNNVSEYFTLHRTLSGAFGLLHRIWGLHVVESVRDKPPVWHPSVRHYRLFNGTELLGDFYFDPFERASKIGVPFTQTLVKRSEVHGSLPGKDRPPIAVMSTSIKAPTPGEPALLQINDVQAVFHELGHVVQILVNRENQALGTSTTLPLDFLEMFSQFYELWATEDNTLGMLAQNYRTHAVLAENQRKELVKNIRRTRPLVLLDRLYMARMDLSLHSDYNGNATYTVLSHRQKIARSTFLLPYSTNNCDICTLVHSFGYGYSSGYYSYLWSEVYSADAMGYFEEVGILNDAQVRAVGAKMVDELLADGLKNDMAVQYEKFRGRPVSTRYWVTHL